MRSLLCALLAAPLVALPAWAQQDTTAADPALPEIAPREVEIRGELDISLPALQRPSGTELLPASPPQPLPPAPLPDPGPVEPPAGAAPRALPGEAGAPSGFADLPASRTGLVEAGAGRYLSRFARVRLEQALTSRWALHSRLDYTGTDGFAPFDAGNVETPADELRGTVTLRTERSALTAALTADGFFGQHRLYGARTLSDEAVPSRSELGEQHAAVELNGGVPVGGMRTEASVHGSTARRPGAPSDSASRPGVSFLDAGTGVWIRRGGGLRIFTGARTLTFSGAEAGGPFFVPDVRLTWQATPRLALYARTDPHAEANRLAARDRENPSLLYESAPQPNVFTLDAEGGLRFFPVPALELSAFAGYRRAPSFLFYEEESTRRYAQGVTDARYGEARILRAGGGLSLQRGRGLNASLSVAYRRGRLEGSDAVIPYFSPLTAEALLSYAFLDGDGHVRLTGSLESTRPVARTGDAEVGLFADLDVESHYALTPSVGLVLELKNLPAGALERFDRYPRPPLVVQGGLRLRL
ncbi:MAG: hypothetical protein BRD47_05745 [Bacteroidetes bacterium QS_8_68_28]|nr:MAG: hypothetical protein BRD47_05745 [Bacteroidetes bacterium QS_8_68_28]